MNKYILFTALILMTIVLSGCSLINGGASSSVGGIIKSSDAGDTWEVKNRVDEKRNISAVETLSIIVDPVDNNKIYLGSKNKGIVVSENNADTWRSLNFPTDGGVYGMAINYFNPQVIYASGILKKRGKIFKTENSGETWTEIYTEPAGGTYVTAMAMNENDPQNIFVGTSAGVILKTSDGGISWDNLYSNSGTAIADIIFSNDSRNNIYFLMYGEKVIVSNNQGGTFTEIVRNDTNNLTSGNIFSIAIDKNRDGTFYLGTDKGIFKTTNHGSNFEELDIIASSKEFPIRAIAVNPSNSNEIIYSAAQAIYKTSDGHERWSTTQLDTNKPISRIEFNKQNPNIIFAGFREFN